MDEDTGRKDAAHPALTFTALMALSVRAQLQSLPWPAGGVQPI